MAWIAKPVFILFHLLVSAIRSPTTKYLKKWVAKLVDFASSFHFVLFSHLTLVHQKWLVLPSLALVSLVLFGFWLFMFCRNHVWFLLHPVECSFSSLFFLAWSSIWDMGMCFSALVGLDHKAFVYVPLDVFLNLVVTFAFENFWILALSFASKAKICSSSFEGAFQVPSSFMDSNISFARFIKVSWNMSFPWNCCQETWVLEVVFLLWTRISFYSWHPMNPWGVCSTCSCVVLLDPVWRWSTLGGALPPLLSKHHSFAAYCSGQRWVIGASLVRRIALLRLLSTHQ